MKKRYYQIVPILTSAFPFKTEVFLDRPLADNEKIVDVKIVENAIAIGKYDVLICIERIVEA